NNIYKFYKNQKNRIYKFSGLTINTPQEIVYIIKKQTIGVATICQLQWLSPLNTFKQNEISYFLASAI
ncbi:hypothetical protein, partial [Bacteroides sp.]